jgi:hypothetical protein
VQLIAQGKPFYSNKNQGKLTMKNKAAKKKNLPENNVVSIMTNPKFKINTNVITVSQTPAKHLECVEVAVNRFGFAANDIIIYRTVFDFSEIKAHTLCIVEMPDEYLIVQNPQPSPNIRGIVEYFQRKISND